MEVRLQKLLAVKDTLLKIHPWETKVITVTTQDMTPDIDFLK